MGSTGDTMGYTGGPIGSTGNYNHLIVPPGALPNKINCDPLGYCPFNSPWAMNQMSIKRADVCCFN